MKSFLVLVFGFVLSIHSSNASCPSELEAVRLVRFDQATEVEPNTGAKSTLTVMEFAVSSNGCTESGDFEIISEVVSDIQKVCIVRKNQDHCKADTSEEILKLESKTLKKSNSSPIVLLNPIKASGVFHQTGDTLKVKSTEVESIQLNSRYTGFETQTGVGSYSSNNAVTLYLSQDGNLVTGTYTAERMGGSVSYKLSAEFKDGALNNVQLFQSEDSIEVNSGWGGWGASACTALKGILIPSAEGKILSGNFSSVDEKQKSICDFKISLTQVFEGKSGACQAGYVWNGSSCVYVGSPAQQPGVCAPGYYWNGTQCVFSGQANPCPGGSIYNGTHCVCPSGTVWNPSAYKCEAQTSNCLFSWNGRCLY